MMNKQIRRMIDEIFADMKMTADNLALRDEMMANAQARFEDSVRAGKTEEEAFAEVAASLGDVQSLLHDMNAEKPGEDKEEKEEKTEEKTAKAETDEAPDFEVRTEKTPDIGDVLGKAFGALGDVGKQIVPQAQKLVRQVDELTGGMIGGIGKAVGKGLSDAQKAAGKAIDKLSGDKGEIVVDFGEEKPKAPAALRKRAQSIRAEAELKQAAGDQEGARALRAKAYALETEADEVEKKLAKLAEQEKAEKAEKPETDDELDALRREMDAMQESLNADAAQVEGGRGLLPTRAD
ncbi:MAG: permease prefix domain 1-containing protein [Christensenellales bacterium]